MTFYIRKVNNLALESEQQPESASENPPQNNIPNSQPANTVEGGSEGSAMSLTGTGDTPSEVGTTASDEVEQAK